MITIRIPKNQALIVKAPTLHPEILADPNPNALNPSTQSPNTHAPRHICPRARGFLQFSTV